ncbi:hypothetical protein HX052_01020 [Myroides marinus]|uniref:DUF5689 domain-containing protein n=1 Tax=Myroides marinus TaxID=703342 RepID=UPI00257609D3|nr:DUF5689 domain-containing protein [Myroides marinus]MDM1368842.1 hypothetical protein [Myroides marinus]MDM1371135.1 hypothetical protein [Myroides marinus]MDM1374085.1 hypothetical protein [Myroides marinus]MDM1382649.1 hypothetical protein [Myroides marinus]MDM1388558.1 hypothetical protein [Myroides marinus]
MKTIFKSLLYFSFAGLILTGCAKNDDFSVPPINCEEPNIVANQTIDGLYSTIKEDSKVVAQYTKDETISGIVISSDQAGNFYQQLYIVDENTQTPVTLKVDIKGGFALYPVGSKVFVKLNGTYIHNSYGMITIGGGIYTSSGGNKYADVITGSKLRNTLYRSCNVKTGDEFNKYINVVTLDQLKTDKTLLGKLIRIHDVQFDRAVVGKTYYDSKDVDGGKQTLRKMVDKKGNALFVRTGGYGSIKGEIIVKESGTVTGIASDYQGTIQFYPRTMVDMDLKNEPFEEGNGGNEGEDPNMKVEPGKFLAFPGSDFNKWDDFLKVILKNSPGDPMVTEGKGLGWNGSNGLQVKGVAALNSGKPANGAMFTVQGIKAPKDATKISFLMKGTAGKSVSINVYKSNGSNYYAYNLDNVNAVSKVLQPNMVETVFNNVPSGNTTNSYTGKIDTKGQWVKVVLDLTALKGDFSTEGKGNLIAFRYGHTENYDLIIDEIRFEDGTPVDNSGPGPEEPGDKAEGEGVAGVDLNTPNVLADFGNWANFVKSTNTYGVLPLAKEGKGQGQNGGGALVVKGTPKGNDFLFSTENQTISSSATKIVFYIKGTAAKSLSINVYDGTSTTNAKGEVIYNSKPYNVLAKVANGAKEIVFTKPDASNSYTGAIDTKGGWTKIVIENPDINKTKKGTVIGIKVGKEAAYDLLIDKISFE